MPLLSITSFFTSTDWVILFATGADDEATVAKAAGFAIMDTVDSVLDGLGLVRSADDDFVDIVTIALFPAVVVVVFVDNTTVDVGLLFS